MTVGRPIRTKKGTRGREVGDNCSFVFHFWHWSWSICSPSCTMRQQNSKLVAVPWLCVICAGGSCLICLMWVVAVVAQDVSKQVTRDGHPSKLMIETYWNPKVSNWVSGIFALYCGTLTDLKPEIMVLYCRLQQEDYMVNKTFRNAFCMRRPDDRAYPKWWPCCSLRGQFWWTVQHSTSGWRGVIPRGFCRYYPRGASPKWWESCCLRKQCPRTMQHSTFRAGHFSCGCWHGSCSCLACFCAANHLGNFGMALKVLCWSLHDLLLMSFAMAWVSPLLFWGWLLAGLLVFVQGFLALWIGWRRCSLSAPSTCATHLGVVH